MTLTQDWLAAIDGTNAREATVEFSRHGLFQHADPVDAARVMFEDADPVREFPSWPVELCEDVVDVFADGGVGQWSPGSTPTHPSGLWLVHVHTASSWCVHLEDTDVA